MTPAVVYLIRHGQPDTGDQPVMLGQSDPPLTDLGRDEIARAARALAGAGIGALYCSPLTRCRQSAALLGAAWGLEPRVEPDWREIHLGQWDGLTVARVRAQWPEAFAARGRALADYRPPGGESFTDLGRRVLPVFRRLTQAPAAPVAVVGHSGVHRVVLCHVLGMPLANLFRLDLATGGWCRLERGADPTFRLTDLRRP